MLGRKRPVFVDKKIEMQADCSVLFKLRDLITAVVNQQVDEFNKRVWHENILPFLSDKNIQEKALTGKVDFGQLYNMTEVEAGEAIKTAIQAFMDGMYLVLIDEKQIENIDDNEIKDSSILSQITY